MKHGITVRERATNKLVEFIECAIDSSALKILLGITMNINKTDYKAEEEFVKEEEIENIGV